MYLKIGTLISKLRNAKNITQAQLAEGIMSRESLNRTENGKQSIQKNKLDALLQKLGHTLENALPHMLSKKEYAIYTQRDMVDNHIAHFDFGTAEVLLNKMEAIPAFHKGLHKQFLLSRRAIICMKRDSDYIGAKILLDEAIRITIPKFRESMVRFCLLTDADIVIINNMACIYGLTKEMDKKTHLLTMLAQNIRENHMSERERTRNLAFVLCTLSIALSEQGHYKEALEACEEAIRESQNNRVYGSLPMLIYNRAYYQYKLGNREEVNELVLQAYYMSKATGMTKVAEQIKTEALTDFGIVLA